MEDFFQKLVVLIETQGIPRTTLASSVGLLCEEFGEGEIKPFFQTAIANLLRYQVFLN